MKKQLKSMNDKNMTYMQQNLDHGCFTQLKLRTFTSVRAPPKNFVIPWRLHYPDMRPNFKSSLRLKYSRYFRFESHPRAQETKMAAGEKVRAESDAADPGYSAAGRACQTERFARFCLRIDFARGCCYMD